MSTQEIMNCIADLVSVAEPYSERINVGFAIADCLTSSREMMAYFNTDGYDPSKLEMLKSKCSADYIRLEYTLAFLDEQHTRYTARTSIYDALQRAKRVNVKNLGKDDAIKFVELYTKIKNLRQESLGCSFNVNKTELSEISDELKRYKV